MNPLKRFPRFDEYPQLERRLNKMVESQIAMRFFGVRGIRVYQNSTGVGIEATGEESRRTRSQFRGEYDQRLAYSEGDEFLVSVGPEAGHYLTIKGVPR
jgi:hypothetical protein